MKISSFDIDGVLYLGKEYSAIKPNPDDIIITGRSIEESKKTLDFLHSRGIYNQVYFNPVPCSEKTREKSGKWKADCLRMLINSGLDIALHFEDDPIQWAILEECVPEVSLVKVISKSEHF
jgi:hypothetical protein